MLKPKTFTASTEANISSPLRWSVYLSWPFSVAIVSPDPTLNVQSTPNSSSSSPPENASFRTTPTNRKGTQPSPKNPSPSSIPALRQSTHIIPTSQDDRLFVLLGVQGTRLTLDVEHINVKKMANSRLSDDGDFFNDLVNAYKNLRGRLRLWFAVWQFRYCHFRKVRCDDFKTGFIKVEKEITDNR